MLLIDLPKVSFIFATQLLLNDLKPFTKIALLGFLILVLHQIGGLSVHHYFGEHAIQNRIETKGKLSIKAQEICSICSNCNYFGGNQIVVPSISIPLAFKTVTIPFAEIAASMVYLHHSLTENKGPPLH